MALGSLCGTLVPRDWDRRVMYAVAGLMNALAALVLLAGNRPSVYAVGTALYLMTTGFCFVWFTALMAEIVGKEARDASTLFSVLNSAESVPLLCMIWLDGVGFRHKGTHGLLWVDASANLLLGAIVFVAFVSCGLSLRRAPTEKVKAGAVSS